MTDGLQQMVYIILFFVFNLICCVNSIHFFAKFVVSILLMHYLE